MSNNGYVTDTNQARASGNVNVMVAPCPGLLSAQIFPPWAVMMALTMERPSPLPPVVVARERSAR